MGFNKLPLIFFFIVIQMFRNDIYAGFSLFSKFLNTENALLTNMVNIKSKLAFRFLLNFNFLKDCYCSCDRFICAYSFFQNVITAAFRHCFRQLSFSLAPLLLNAHKIPVLHFFLLHSEILKGIVYANITILPSYTHSHFVPNLYDWILWNTHTHKSNNVFTNQFWYPWIHRGKKVVQF